MGVYDIKSFCEQIGTALLLIEETQRIKIIGQGHRQKGQVVDERRLKGNQIIVLEPLSCVYCNYFSAPKQFISGEMHYFRVPQQFWRDRLEKMKLGGIKVVSFPINMFVHNPEPGIEYTTEVSYLNFLKLIKELKMEAIIKMGPFIDADLSFGGLKPHSMWKHYELTTDFIWLRNDENKNYLNTILNSVKEICLSLVEDYFAKNGGPIIMLQLEQDYGHESGLCKTNTTWLQLLEKTIRYNCHYDGIIYVSDANSRNNLLCGGYSDSLNGTIHLRDATLDSQSIANYHWSLLKANIGEIIGKKTPFFVSDFPSGKTLSWHDRPYNTNYTVINNLIRKILSSGSSLNYYMYVGGTNFGFLAGDSGQFTQGYITSYDNNAPISESGELTNQFFELRKIINEHFNTKSNSSVRVKPTLRKYPSVHLEPVGCMLCESVKYEVARPYAVIANTPLTFRELNQTSGFVLYETQLKFQPDELSILECIGVVDRGYVYFRYVFMGYFNRFTHFKITLKQPNYGDSLQILVEDNGRLSHGFRLNMDVKGITRPVYLDGRRLTNWTMYQYPFSYAPAPYISKDMVKLFAYIESAPAVPLKLRTPMFYRGQFYLKNPTLNGNSTYIDMSEWGKGIVFLNGISLGRYWSIAGPQVKLFLPGVYLFKYDLNVLVVLELERPPLSENFDLKFSDDRIMMFRSAKNGPAFTGRPPVNGILNTQIPKRQFDPTSASFLQS
ncbi:beta-galactosidase-like [Chrysoperla carnea]|uniref:beta-galactosidase-like n=1 Tax=Chrysoperla carnea TaxID=189513 RepID=UPI001D08E79F|nr:beta-galactosidase-like [Chrysoperla carnea]